MIEDLVAANHILFDQGVVDGFGHVSARHDRDPNRFLLSRSMAPGLVTPADIMEFDLDGAPVDPRGRAVHLERFIHGEIFRMHPEVRSVVHSHSPAVIPFGVSRTAALVQNSDYGRGAPAQEGFQRTRWDAGMPSLTIRFSTEQAALASVFCAGKVRARRLLPIRAL